MRNLLFVCATHGDEGFSVNVFQDMEKTYDPSRYGYDWIIGNPLALEQGIRFVDKDLNRSAPGNLKSRFYEDRRAAEIILLSQRYDALVDVHGSVADCGLVTIIADPTAENINLAKSIPVKRNVVWYSAKSASTGPLTQHASCPAVEIECGPQSEMRTAKRLKSVIGTIILANVAASTTALDDQEYYSVYGSKLGAVDNRISDFDPVTMDDETFYPFMSNQYAGKLCYKMRKIDEDELNGKIVPYNGQ